MAWQYVAAAGAAAIGYKIYERATTSTHNLTIKRTYKALTKATPDDATIYADHIDPGQNPEGVVDDVSGIPDIVVTSGRANNLIIEVETADSLENNPTHVRKQLAGFGKRSYTRVLVVPASSSARAAGTSFLDGLDTELSDSIQLATPKTVSELL